jgi:ribosomal protein L11 methylase PrmA
LAYSAGEGENSVELIVGDSQCLKGAFDIVAANLIAPILIELAGSLTSMMSSFLVLSGIADAMAGKVIDAYLAKDINLVTLMTNGGWNAALFEK